MRFSFSNTIGTATVVLGCVLGASVAKAADFTCFAGDQIRFIETGKTKSLNRRFCIKPDPKLVVNAECREKLDCLAMRTRKLKESQRRGHGPIGNPLHSYCHAAKGTPMIIEYQFEGKWEPGSICHFEDDSFVNLEYLASYLIDFKN